MSEISPEIAEALKNNDTNEVKKYLSNGGDVDANSDGRSILFFAVANVRVEISRLLLENGANPNMQDNDTKQAPLHMAGSWKYKDKEKEQIDVINLLLKYGANPHLEELYGDTALTITKARNFAAASEVLKNAMGIK